MQMFAENVSAKILKQNQIYTYLNEPDRLLFAVLKAFGTSIDGVKI